MPALSKSVLCCSEREGKLFVSTSPKTKVNILGLPLQVCLNLNQKVNLDLQSTKRTYDILILGRDGKIWEIEEAYKILKNMKRDFGDKSVLIRHHPK